MKISVIVPVYKVEPYLRRCADSILAQTFSDLELILIDDGSPDCCGQICEEYAEADSRVIVIHQDNGGLSAARNAGIDWAFANSDSDWLMFVDSDDWIAPYMLEMLFEANRLYGTEVSSCGFLKAFSDHVQFTERTEAVFSPIKPEDYYLSNRVNATVAWGKLYHKRCFKNIRYPVGKLNEDEYVTYRILFEQDHIAVTDAGLYAYLQRQDGIMRQCWTPGRMDVFKAFKSQILFFEKRHLDQLTELLVHNYVEGAVHQIKLVNEAIQLEPRQKQYYIKQLQKKSRRMIFRYRRRNYFPLEENYALYENIRPIRMRFYLYRKAAVKKLKGLVRR